MILNLQIKVANQSLWIIKWLKPISLISLGFDQIVEILIKNGADVSLKNDAASTPKDIAKQQGEALV